MRMHRKIFCRLKPQEVRDQLQALLWLLVKSGQANLWGLHVCWSIKQQQTCLDDIVQVASLGHIFL